MKLVTAPHPACAGSCAREKFLSVERHLGAEWLERCLFSNRGWRFFELENKQILDGKIMVTLDEGFILFGLSRLPITVANERFRLGSPTGQGDNPGALQNPNPKIDYSFPEHGRHQQS